MSTNIVRILSFDPGLSVSGWAVLDYNRTAGELTVFKFGLLTPNAIVSRVNMKEEVDKYGKRLIALVTLRQMITEIYDEFKPDFVVVEDNFFHSKYPTAYAALLHWTITVDFLLRDNYGQPVYKIPPKLVKQHVTGSGDAKKINIQEAIINNPKIKFKNKQMPFSLIEHTADAIAIGWAFIYEVLPILET